MIPLIRPYIDEKTKQRVCDVLDSGYLTEGPVTRELEQAVAGYVGVEHCLAVTSCTTGLELALRSMDIGPGDEVIVPDYTYPATASVVAIVGATPVIVDVVPETMLIDPQAVTRALTEKTKAIMPVSIFGNPLEYDWLDELKTAHGLYVIEDAACSLGAMLGDEMVGRLADITVFSCHPRKSITTGEGGLITTSNGDWAEHMLSYKHFGMGVANSRLTTSFDRIGTNYKLSNILAAVGLSQMEMVDELFARRRELAQRYIDRLAQVDGVLLPQVTAGGRHAYQSFCVFVRERDRIMASMRERGIEAQIGTYALHMHKAFAENDKVRIAGSMEGSRYAFDHCLTLPLFHEMQDDELELVVETLKALVN